MATFTVNKDMRHVSVGPFTFDISAGVTQSAPDDLMDEVQAIIQNTPGFLVTILGYDRTGGNVGLTTWKDEGVSQTTTATTVNVVGDAIAVSGSGATATLTSTAVKNVEGGLEVIQTIGTSGASQTLNLATANAFFVTLTANCTITLSGATTGKLCSMTVTLVQDATGSRAVTWPASVTWPAGSPILTTIPAGVDAVVLYTSDGGTTWYGFSDLLIARQEAMSLTNRSGGSVARGDVVKIDTTNDESFTTNTTGQAEVSVGVALETIASNAAGRILISGYAPIVNVPSSVARGSYIETHTVAKQATGNATRRSGSFGQFLTAGTTPTGWLWGQTDQTASAAAAITSGNTFMTVDVNLTTANVFVDLVSISLAAGTYQLKGSAVMSNGAATNMTLKLWDGTNVFHTMEGRCTGAGIDTPLVVFDDAVVLGSTTTVKISAATGNVTGTCHVIGAGTEQNLTANKTTKLSWTKIA